MIVGATTTTAATSPLYVMDLATRNASWAATRQAAIAGNIANANTPGYKSRDIEPFVAEAEKTKLQMATTRGAHLSLTPMQMSAGDVTRAEGWDMTHSANDVSVDEQLAKADETARQHQLSVSVLGTFHRMLMTSVSFR